MLQISETDYKVSWSYQSSEGRGKTVSKQIGDIGLCGSNNITVRHFWRCRRMWFFRVNKAPKRFKVGL